MAYIGVQPTDTYLSIASQQITGNGGATYTLDYSVSDEESVAVFVNNVRQNVSTYTVSGTSLTLGGTISASDSCWVLFLGRTVGTKTPAVGSVTNDMLAGSIANSKLANSSITLNGSAVSLGGSASVTNTPAFMAYLGSSQTCNVGVRTKMQLTQEIIDTDNAFDNSTNYRFTVPSGEGGYYYISFGAGRAGWASNRFQVTVSKNGSDFLFAESYSNVNDYTTANGSGIINLSASDYLELFVWHNGPASPSVRGSTTEVFTYLGGSKLIGA